MKKYKKNECWTPKFSYAKKRKLPKKPESAGSYTLSDPVPADETHQALQFMDQTKKDFFNKTNKAE